jgi:hypothetical protein
VQGNALKGSMMLVVHTREGRLVMQVHGSASVRCAQSLNILLKFDKGHPEASQSLG